MIAVLFVLAIAAAGVGFGMRRRRKRHARLVAAEQPGATPDAAIPIHSFTEMDRYLERRLCACGASLRSTGEGSRELDGRRYRVALLTCPACEEEQLVFFDTTDLLQ